jgi:hypothetical protein
LKRCRTIILTENFKRKNKRRLKNYQEGQYFHKVVMDFDTAKENIQPLRQGRRADRLEAVLGSEANKELLEQEKK